MLRKSTLLGALALVGALSGCNPVRRLLGMQYSDDWANRAMAGQLDFWPTDDDLPADGVVVVPVRSGRGAGAPVLHSDGEPDVPLRSVARHREATGSFDEILVPAKSLTPGSVYSLGLDGHADAVRRAGAGNPVDRPVQWKASARRANPTPWTAPPCIIKDNRCSLLHRMLLACSSYPFKWVIINAPTDAQLFRVQVTGSSTGDYLMTREADGNLEFDNDCCTGHGPSMEPGTSYSVTLTALDGAGHEYPAPGPALSFDGFESDGP